MASVKYLANISTRSSDPFLRAVFAQIKHEFGAIAQPFVVHAASPEILACLWVVIRESILVGTVPRALKEVVATTVSAANACPYCVDAHSAMLHAVGASELADRLDQGLPLPAKIEALAQWARTTGVWRPDAARRPPVEAAEAPEIIATALIFHYINRLVTIFLEPSPLPALPLIPKRWLKQFAGMIFKSSAARAKTPGAGLALLGDFPTEINRPRWADGNRILADAFGYLDAAMNRAAANVAEAVRIRLNAHLQRWQGEAAPLGRGWLDDCLAEIAVTDRAALGLALLTARAPHQIIERDIIAFQQQSPSSRALLELTAYSSWCATMRLAEWMAPVADP